MGGGGGGLVIRLESIKFGPYRKHIFKRISICVHVHVHEFYSTLVLKECVRVNVHVYAHYKITLYKLNVHT